MVVVIADLCCLLSVVLCGGGLNILVSYHKMIEHINKLFMAVIILSLLTYF